MSPLASTFITSALVLYSIGVWGERLVGRLGWWHFGFFVLGLVCDTAGTGLMFDFVGGMTFDVHGISGLIAILLMLVHAVWALAALLKQDDAILNTSTGSACSCGWSGWFPTSARCSSPWRGSRRYRAPTGRPRGGLLPGSAVRTPRAAP